MTAAGLSPWMKGMESAESTMSLPLDAETHPCLIRELKRPVLAKCRSSSSRTLPSWARLPFQRMGSLSMSTGTVGSVELDCAVDVEDIASRGVGTGRSGATTLEGAAREHERELRAPG